MLAGELPTRDFADPGMPLMYAVSAAGQWLGGRSLMAEAVLVYGAMAAGAALLTLAVRDLTESMFLGLWAGASLTLIGPRTYSYPKILLYAAAVYLFAWAARTKSPKSAFFLSALTSIAFLFRHDHGVYIGAASAVAMVTVAQGSGRDRLRALARYVAFTAFLLLPYLFYVHVHRGLVPYVRTAVAFSSREALRTDLKSWAPSLRAEDARAAAAAALFYTFWAVPVLTVLVMRRSKGEWPSSTAAATAICVLALAANAGFLRDRLEDRIADAIIPAATLTAILGGWLIQRQASRPRRVAASFVVAGALLAFSVIEAQVSLFSAQVARSRIWEGPGATIARWEEVGSELRNPRSARQMPSAVALALMPFFEYASACTRPNDSIFVPGFAPEVSYFAQRRFAGGHVTLPGDYYSSDAEQRATINVLKNESVPLVVLPPGSREALDRFQPTIAAWLRGYTRVATYTDHQNRMTDVLVRTDLPALRSHMPTGLPCFR